MSRRRNKLVKRDPRIPQVIPVRRPLSLESFINPTGPGPDILDAILHPKRLEPTDALHHSPDSKQPLHFEHPNRIRKPVVRPSTLGVSLPFFPRPSLECVADLAGPETLLFHAPEETRPGRYREVKYGESLDSKTESLESCFTNPGVSNNNLNVEEDNVAGLGPGSPDVKQSPLVVLICRINFMISSGPTQQLRRVGNLPIRPFGAFFEEGDMMPPFIPQRPTTRDPSPLELCLSPSFKPPTYTSRSQRHVSFASDVLGYDLTSPRQEADLLNPLERHAKQVRVAAHDEFYENLHTVCLGNPKRFIPRIPNGMSQRRQSLATEESRRFWNHLQRECVSFSSDPAHEIRLRMMERLFRLVWRNAFRVLPKPHEVMSQAAVVDEVRRVVDMLIGFFSLFEYNPAGEDRPKFVRELTRLAFSAYRLRALLRPTGRFAFRVTVPLYMRKATRRLDLLRNNVSVFETHGSTNINEDSADIVYMMLCGGIVRSTVGGRRPDGTRAVVCDSVQECRAVCVSWRPALFETVSPWAGKFDDQTIEVNAWTVAQTLARDLRYMDNNGEV